MYTSTQATGSNGVERRPALHGAAEFVSWTWEMINAGVECGWSPDGTEIVVSNPEKLQADVIPVYFRHGQYSSWVRALNAYNFKKTRPGAWHHPHFQRGRPELLKQVTRQPRKKPDRAKAAAAAAAAASTSTSSASSPSHSPMDYQDYFDEKMGPYLKAHLQNRARPSTSPSTEPTGASGETHNMSTWALLAEERSKVDWMRQQLVGLEAQLQAIREEEFSQRAEAHKIGAFLWSELRALAPPKLHPELARLAAPYLSAQEKQTYLPLTYLAERDRGEGGEADGCKTLATLAALTTLRPHLAADPPGAHHPNPPGAAAPVDAQPRPFASFAAAANTLAATTAAAAAATAAAIRRCAPPAPPPPLPPPPAQPTAHPPPAASEGGEGGEALFSIEEIASAAGVDDLLALETEDQVLGHAGDLFCELMRFQDREGHADEVKRFFETEAGAALRQIARNGCQNCELTAFALAKVCSEWQSLCAIYQRVLATADPCAAADQIAESGDAATETRLCGAVQQTVHQLSSAIEKLGHLGITHEAMAGVHQAQPARQLEQQAQAVADLHEHLNTVELNALARDPDLLSSLPGLEQLMDSTRSSEAEQLVQMAA